MDKQKENRTDDYETDRNSSEETSCIGRWESGRRFRANRHHQHHRRHRKTGA